jgi:hypothetical protein
MQSRMQEEVVIVVRDELDYRGRAGVQCSGTEFAHVPTHAPISLNKYVCQRLASLQVVDNRDLHSDRDRRSPSSSPDTAPRRDSMVDEMVGPADHTPVTPTSNCRLHAKLQTPSTSCQTLIPRPFRTDQKQPFLGFCIIT